MPGEEEYCRLGNCFHFDIVDQDFWNFAEKNKISHGDSGGRILFEIGGIGDLEGVFFPLCFDCAVFAEQIDRGVISGEALVVRIEDKQKTAVS